MIEIEGKDLLFSFEKVHKNAKLYLSFQRTLRIPDDDREYHLPPGLGTFPLVHVDDYEQNVPKKWIQHGGVMLPMYQSEAMWIHFRGFSDPGRSSTYPFAIKICTGKINAVTGEQYQSGLKKNPQDYVTSPKQPWLDGYCIKEGVIRQFVAMALGDGYTAEEQITGEAEHGGLQITVYPMKGDRYDALFPKREFSMSGDAYMSTGSWGALPAMAMAAPASTPMQVKEMGLAPGGKMKQQIYNDDFKLDDWDLENSSRCFVHITNSTTWAEITGTLPPHLPPSAKDYTYAGLPWFDYYDGDSKALKGSSKLSKLESVQKMSAENGNPVPNESLSTQETVIPLKKNPKEVREGDF